jgi:peroxiredoxin
MVSKGPVVLVVLRGYPGYQCPYCNRQVQEFIQKSQGFSDAGAHVMLVYPGPPQDLGARANEFLVGKKLPNNFDLMLDQATRSRTSTDFAGMSRNKPLIRRPS